MLGFLRKDKNQDIIKNEKAFSFLIKCPDCFGQENNFGIVCDLVRDMTRSGYYKEAEMLKKYIQTEEEQKMFMNSVLTGESYSLPVNSYVKKLRNDNSHGWFLLLQRLIRTNELNEAVKLFKEKKFWKESEDADKFLKTLTRFSEDSDTIIGFIKHNHFKDKINVLKWIREVLIAKRKDFDNSIMLLEALNFYNDRSKAIMMYELLMAGFEDIAEEMLESITIKEYYNEALFEILKHKISLDDYASFKQYSQRIKKTSKATKPELDKIEAAYWIKYDQFDKIANYAFPNSSMPDLFWSCIRFKKWQFAIQIIEQMPNKKGEFYAYLSDSLVKNSELNLSIEMANKITAKEDKGSAFSSLVKVLAEKNELIQAEQVLGDYIQQTADVYVASKSIALGYAKINDYDNAHRMIDKIPNGLLKVRALDDIARYILGFNPWTNE